MLQPIRRSPQTHLVLELLLRAPSTWRYGYDISLETQLKSGTLYPVLQRLHERGWLETRWDTAEPGRPPRHMYRLTAEGRKAAHNELSVERRLPLRPHLAAEGE